MRAPSEDIVTSSINRIVSVSSPFNVGRGPRAGSINTFHGHSGGIHPLQLRGASRSFPFDIPFFVDLITLRRNHLGINRDVRVRRPDPVEQNIQVALAPKSVLDPSLLPDGRSYKRRAETRLRPNSCHRAEMAQDRIADLHSSGGKIRLVHCALQERARGNEYVLRASV